MKYFDIQPGDLMCYAGRKGDDFHLVTECQFGYFGGIKSISIWGICTNEQRVANITWALDHDRIDGRWTVWRNGERIS